MSAYEIETRPTGTNVYRKLPTTSPLTAQIIPTADGSAWVTSIFRTAFNGTAYAEMQYGALSTGWVPVDFPTRMQAEVFTRRVLGLL